MPNNLAQKTLKPVTEKTDKRTLIWLWMFISKYFSAIPIGSYGMPGMIEKIQNALYEIQPAIIEQQRQANLLEASFYAWIKDDIEQLAWLTEKLINFTNPSTPIIQSMHNDRDYVIGLLDLANSTTIINYDSRAINEHIIKSRQSKKELVHQIKNEWEKHNNEKKVLEWFNDKKDPIRLEAGWHVFKKQFSNLAQHRAEFTNYQELLYIFDSNNVPTIDRLYFLSSAKKRCSQLKNKEKHKGEKVQCNVEISPSAVNKLKKLSAKHQLSQAAVIEILLNKEYETNTFIPEALGSIRKYCGRRRSV